MYAIKEIKTSLIILPAFIVTTIICEVMMTRAIGASLGKNAAEKLSFEKNGDLKKIDKLNFLIHALCYADMAYNKNANDLAMKFKRFLEYEKIRAEKWRSKLHNLADNEILIIIPWPGNKNGPASQYNSLATSILGDRCFILDCPDSFDPAFWSDNSEDFQRVIIQELKSAMVYQKDKWNDEELHTALHSLACCRQLNSMLLQRGYCFDKTQVLADSWGASFDGCVTKYTLNIRRMLKLSHAIEINFDLTVPDAAFLLEASFSESVLLPNGLRLFLFRRGNQAIGLYTMTSHALKDKAIFVQIDVNQRKVTIMSKQGIQLWPIPEPYHLPQAAIGQYEPVQELVTFENNKIRLPVSAGFVYRLAKAPVYIFSGPDTPYQEFKDILLNAETICD